MPNPMIGRHWPTYRINARSLNGISILVAALSWILHGCAATSLPLPVQSNAPSLDAVSQFDDRFGKLSWGQWAGAWRASDGPMPFVVDWCRAAYSDYDVMQSNGYFKERGVYVARLSWGAESQSEKRHVFLSSGLAYGKDISLWQVPLPPADKVGDVQAISEHIQRLNARLQETREAWHTLRLDVDGTGETVEIKTLPSSGLSALSAGVAPARHVDHPTPAPEVWIGTCHDPDDALHNFQRLVLFPAPEARGWTHFGLISSSRRDRWLEGPVPPGSPWRSREQFVRFIQKAWELGVESFDNPLPSEAEALLQREIGQVISSAELKKDAEEIFGSWDAMIAATCPAAELWHGPVFATMHGESALILSIQWYYEQGQAMPWVHSFQREIIPNVGESVSVVDIDWVRFPQDGGELKIRHIDRFGSWFRLTPSERHGP